MFPSLSIIVPHVLISSHDHLLFSIIIHSYQLQLLFINDDYFLFSSSLLLFIIKYYYHILYISHIIPYYPHVFLSWYPHGFLRRTKSARSCSWKPPWARPFSARSPGWVVIFRWEKMSFSLEHVGNLWEMMGKYGKIMGKDGKIWNNYGKIRVSTWWVVVRSSFCGL